MRNNGTTTGNGASAREARERNRVLRATAAVCAFVYAVLPACAFCFCSGRFYSLNEERRCCATTVEDNVCGARCERPSVLRKSCCQRRAAAPVGECDGRLPTRRGACCFVVLKSSFDFPRNPERHPELLSARGGCNYDAISASVAYIVAERLWLRSSSPPIYLLVRKLLN